MSYCLDCTAPQPCEHAQPRWTPEKQAELEQHLDIVARWSIHSAFEAWVEEAWGNYMPDVGEYDFDLMVERAERLLPPDVTFKQIGDTHAWFAERAKGVKP